MTHSKCKAMLFLGILGAVVARGVYAVPVSLELSLLVDASSSISDTFSQQMAGYAAAFESTAVKNAISNTGTGSIAVNMVVWSGKQQQSQVIGWTSVSASTADTFAGLIRGVARPFAGNSAPQMALAVAADASVSAADNGFEGSRTIIDISGDGISNDDPGNNIVAGTFTTFGRDNALDVYDAINAIVISSDAAVLDYYEDYVVGGSGAFALQVDSFDTFAAGVESKLVAEIAAIPVPAAAWLFGSGLLALSGFSFQRKK